jgi:outer membrane protein assembly factor BamB
MARRSLFLFVISIAAAVVAGALLAAGITVKSAVVDQVSSDGKTITVKFKGSDEATELSVKGEIDVLLDGKHAELTAIKPGMAVTVQIDGTTAERIIAHTDSPKTTKPTRPKPTAKSSTTKTSTTKKSKPPRKKSSSKKDQPNDLDNLPVAMTPLGGMKNPAGASGGGGGGGGAWPCFLGPNRDNQSQETGLLKEWPEGGPPPAWPSAYTGLGQGYSNVSVANGTVFTMGTPDGQESVLAIDLEKGKLKWSVPTGADVFRDDQGNGPRATPTIDGNFIYALGARGDLVCIDGDKQAVRWHKSFVQDFGSPGVKWGFAESVLIDGSRLICTPGAPGAMMVALNKMDGTLAWKCASSVGSPAPGYASPVLADAAGTRQYITYTAAGVVGVRATDGQFLWGNNTTANTPANCTTPLVNRDFVFVSSGYNGGGALIRLAEGENGAVQSTLVYRTHFMNSHFGGMVGLGGNVYGASGDVLTCLNVEHNEVLWQNRSVGKCSITYADGNLYVRGENGPVALVEATPDGYHEKGRFNPPTSGNGRAWAYPVVAAGRLFLRDEDGLACYSLRNTNGANGSDNKTKAGSKK